MRSPIGALQVENGAESFLSYKGSPVKRSAIRYAQVPPGKARPTLRHSVKCSGLDLTEGLHARSVV